MKTYLHLDSVRHLSINQFALVASAIGATIIVGVLAFLLFNGQPAIQPTASNTTASEISLNQERKEDHQWLEQRNATIVDAWAMVERQEELKEQWLARYNNVAPEVSPMQDRKEELAFLAARANAKAMVERQEDLKEQWLARGNVIGVNIIATMRQDDLKERWLEQHTR